ncbi:MAG: methyltransferase domain-containing protein [Bacillota bacterium]
MNDNEKVRDFIRKTYSDIAMKGAEGCGCGCSCESNDLPLDIKETSLNIGYSAVDLANAPAEANMGLGCGNPIGMAGLKEREIVLDLGSGGGFDCFLARMKVGDMGSVIGVDMTPEMIKLSRSNAQKYGYTNVEFRLGEIEHLPVICNEKYFNL